MEYASNISLFSHKHSHTTIFLEIPHVPVFQKLALIYSFIVYGCLNCFNYGIILRLFFYGLLLIFAIGSLLVNWKYISAVTKFALPLLMIAGTILYLFTDTFLVLLVSACGACLVNVPLSTIFKTGFYSQLIFFCILVFISMLGFNRKNDLVPLMDSLRNYRFSLGFSHPNTAASYFFFTTILFFCYKKNYKLYHIFIFALLSFIVFILTDSKTIAILDILLAIVLIINKLIVLPKSIVYCFSILFPCFVILCLILCLNFSESSLDGVLSGRLSYGLLAINTGLTLFGNDISFPVDMMYINLLFNDGLIIFLFYTFIFISYFLILGRFFNSPSRSFLSLIGAVILIYAISETYAQNFVSPFVIVVFSTLFTKKTLLTAITNKDYLSLDKQLLLKTYLK